MQKQHRVRRLQPGEIKKIGKMIDTKMNRRHQTKERRIAVLDEIVDAPNGFIQDLTGVATGDANGERIGLDIFPTLIDFFWEVIVDDITNVFRISLIHWKEDDAINPPTLANLFEDNAVVRPFSPWKFSNKGANREFTVLHDRIYTLNQDGHNNRAGRIRLFGKRLPNNIHFNDNASLNSIGGVYLVVRSDSSVGGPVFKLQGVFKYKN